MQELTSAQVRQSIKYLVEIGGAAQVLDDDTIELIAKDEAIPLTVKTATGKTATVKILSENMRTPQPGVEEVILNPFKETVAIPVVLVVFYRQLNCVLSKMIHRVIQRTLEEPDESDLSCDEVLFMGSFKTNSKMLKEFEQFRWEDMITVRYDRQNMKTRVVSPFLTKLEESKIRKGTKDVLAKMFNAIFQDYNLTEFESEFTTMSVKQCSAILSTMCKIYDTIGGTLQTMLGVTIDMGPMKEIIGNLAEYAKFTSWVMTCTAHTVDEDRKASTSVDTGSNIIDVKSSDRFLPPPKTKGDSMMVQQVNQIQQTSNNNKFARFGQQPIQLGGRQFNNMQQPNQFGLPINNMQMRPTW